MHEKKHVKVSGTQGDIMKNSRDLYRNYFKIPVVDRIIKILVNFIIDIVAAIKGFKFPQKYLWDWKLEMLSYKFEAETVKVFKKFIKPGMVVFDIGGHIGYYSRLFSKLVGPEGKVYVFEPTLENFELLKNNTKAYSNVTLINKAVGDYVGKIDFYQTFSNTGSHSLLKPEVKSQKISVDCISLDEFCRIYNIDKINTMKIDVEGAELMVLKGAEGIIKQSDNLFLIIELINDNLEKSGFDQVSYFEYLNELGFEIYKILNTGNIDKFDVNNFDWEEMSQGKIYINLFLKK